MATIGQEAGLFDEPLKGSFVTERLLEDLREQIKSGVLKPGELIRPVRELMKQYGISYNSVRKALNQLSEEGHVTLEQGRGTFVKKAKVPRSEDHNIITNKKVKKDKVDDNIRYEDSKERLVSGVPVYDQGLAKESAEVEAEASAPGDSESLKIYPPSVIPDRGTRPQVEVLIAAESDAFGSGWLPEALHAFQEAALSSGLAVKLVPGWQGDAAPLTGRGWVLCGQGVSASVEKGRYLVQVAVGRLLTEVGSSVLPDGFGGAHALIGRLCVMGHREFAVLWPASGQDGRTAPVAGSLACEALAGARVALEEAGRSLAPGFGLGVAPAEEWLADRLLTLSPRPSAVLVTEQALAARLMVQLRERGLTVPRAMSVVCFGGVREENAFDITSARIDGAEVGRCALNRLRELMAGAINERMRIRIPISFHQGTTVGPV